MNSAYVFSLLLTVLSNIAYHFCQKGIPGNVSPLLSLLATYVTAIVATGLALLFLGPGEDTSLSVAMGRLTWPSFALGFAAVGLELGFLWAYRSGWKISMAAICSNAIVTLALIPVGIFIFHEGFTVRKGLGVVLALSGLWALSGG
jgi:lysylphosphatidylglycerol synthetase-like protein (DUF2156 family)